MSHIPNPINVKLGGTGKASVTDEALLKGNGTGVLDEIVVGTNGHVLTVVTGSPAWAAPVAGGSFIAAGDSGTPQTISNGDTLTIAGGVGLSSDASVGDIVTINLDSPVAVSLGGTGVDKSATGGALQIVKQLSAGAVLTSGVILSAEIASALTTPTAIGSVTPSSGAFTTVTASTPIGVASGGAGASLSGTGGTSFMVKQLSVGAALTTGLITSAELTTALTTPPPIGSAAAGTGFFTELTAKLRSSVVNTVLTIATLARRTTDGGAALGIGGRLLFQLESATVEDRNAGNLEWRWTTVTDASRSSAIDIFAVLNAVDTRSATFTPTGINDTVIGATTPAAVAATALTSTSLTTTVSTATTNDVVTATTIGVNSTGTPVAGFGGRLNMLAKSDTTNDRSAAFFDWRFTTIADATRTSALDVYVANSGAMAVVATFTPTGINGAAIGATTPSTGAFTGLQVSNRTLSANTTLTTSDCIVFVNTVSGNVTITLPTAASSTNTLIKVKKITTANTLTVSGNGTNIDNAATLAWTARWTAYEFYSDGTKWFIVGSFL